MITKGRMVVEEEEEEGEEEQKEEQVGGKVTKGKSEMGGEIE